MRPVDRLCRRAQRRHPCHHLGPGLAPSPTSARPAATPASACSSMTAAPWLGFGENAARDRVLGFYWSRDSGMVPIDVEGGGTRLVADLNNRGEVVGDTVIDGHTAAYYWTLRRGLIPLPTGPATDSDVFDINNGGTMVGQIWRRPVDWRRRAPCAGRGRSCRST
ncbi:hypothetical protein LP420_10960 [Massilia sp. B-10]|nr:hypothetical protein LP420_10960 [Massilia sp. B-10]